MMTPAEKAAIRLRAFKSAARLLEIGRAHVAAALAGKDPAIGPQPIDRYLIRDGLAEVCEVVTTRWEPSPIAAAGKLPVIVRSIGVRLTDRGKVAYLKICVEVNAKASDNGPNEDGR